MLPGTLACWPVTSEPEAEPESSRFAVKNTSELFLIVPKFEPDITTSEPYDPLSGEMDAMTGRAVCVSDGTATGIAASFAKKKGFDLPAAVPTITSPS